MKKELQLVNFEQAKRLKSAGFDWAVPSFYFINEKSEINGTLIIKEKYQLKGYENWKGWYYWDATLNCRVSAPTVAIALKWIRDVKIIHGYIDRAASGWYFEIDKANNGASLLKDFLDKFDYFDTYEAAEIALLDEILTLIENKK